MNSILRAGAVMVAMIFAMVVTATKGGAMPAGQDAIPWLECDYSDPWNPVCEDVTLCLPVCFTGTCCGPT